MGRHISCPDPKHIHTWGTHRARQVPCRGGNVRRCRRECHPRPAALAAAVPRHRRGGHHLAVAIISILCLARAASQDECPVSVHRAQQLFPAALLQQRAVQGLHL